MQRRINRANRHRKSVHRLEHADKIRSLASPRTRSRNSRSPGADARTLELLRVAYTSGGTSHGTGGRRPIE